MPFNYDQPSSSGDAISPESLRHMFQWPDEEDEGSGYASFGTISSVQTRFVSVSLVDNSDANLYRRREAQEKTTKAQQESFDNIQYLLEQLLTNKKSKVKTSSSIMRRRKSQ